MLFVDEAQLCPLAREKCSSLTSGVVKGGFGARMQLADS